MPYGDETPEMPSSDHNYHRNLQTKPWRTDLKPLDVVQPEGPSFSVEGNLVRWQNWSIRVGFNYREGLVLHDVRCVVVLWGWVGVHGCVCALCVVWCGSCRAVALPMQLGCSFYVLLCISYCCAFPTACL